MIEPALGYQLPERVLEELENASSVAEIERITAGFLADIGFRQYTYYLVRREPYGEQLQGYFSNFDPRWLERYTEQAYVGRDLLQIHGRRSVLPMRWKPRTKKGIPADGAKVFSEAQDFGIRDGITVPIHGPGSFALMSAVADGSPREREQTLRHGLEAVTTLALHVHEYAAAIMAANGMTSAPEAIELTDRERTCLRWVALGKTSHGIAEILGISTGTVDQHVARIRDKLQCGTRAQAAVRAMHLSLIESS